jgi:stage V sporulation protein R
MSRYQHLFSQIQLWDDRLTKAGTRMGLAPYPTIYEMVSDEQMIRLIPYTMMPSHYRHWSFGKKYEQQIKESKGFHIFEAVINSNPSHCYLGVTNDMLMQVLVMAHAKWGHVDFFANNRHFGETQPESLDNRLAQHAEYIKRLVENPTFGWSKVEYILDAAHALDEYIGWLPTVKDAVPDKEAREKLEQRLVELQLQLPRIISEFEKSNAKAEIAELEVQLKVMPIRPTSDLLGFLMDEKHNPRLGDEARGMISIVRDQSRYFQPQGRTKIMNEGWASYWEKVLLQQPELQLPFEWSISAAQAWSMHNRTATDSYFNPYALGLAVFDYIDRKHGFDEGTEEIEVEELAPMTCNATGEEKGECTTSNEYYVATGKTKKVTITKRNRDELFRVRKNHDDASFLRTFLTEELFEHINLQNLEWVRRVMEQINRMLISKGWAFDTIVDPIPLTLEGMMAVVEKWMNLAETAEMMRADLGQPLFPAPSQTLKTMATVLQIVGAFDEDKSKARQMLVLRTGYSQVPVINVIDSGIYTDGSLTLRHEFDENFGPLLQSECKDTVRFVRRLWGRPVRLITKEIQVDRHGRPLGGPLPYEYYCDEDGEVKERWLD